MLARKWLLSTVNSQVCRQARLATKTGVTVLARKWLLSTVSPQVSRQGRPASCAMVTVVVWTRIHLVLFFISWYRWVSNWHGFRQVRYRLEFPRREWGITTLAFVTRTDSYSKLVAIYH